jgi:RNA recognition motif-containing protein
MSLFIGNIPRTTAPTDLHTIFNRFGRCSVDHKGSFAFIDFDHLKSAESALSVMQGKEIEGSALSIEWSKKTRKKSKLPEPSNTSRNISKSDIECYMCREKGHVSKECKYRQLNPKGHTLPIDETGIIDNLRKNYPSRIRFRRKSPNRYQDAMRNTFSIVKLE